MKNTNSVARPDPSIFPLSELAENCAIQYGPYVAMRTWTGEGHREMTYNQFRDWVHAIAKWLISQGIARDDRIAVLGENSPQWGAAYLAIQTAGAIAVPVDSMMPPTGIRHIISDSGSRLLFASERFLRDLSEVAPIPTLEKVICLSECGYGGTLAFQTVIEAGAKQKVEFPKRELNEIAAILYTSGTTGHSKGVMLTQGNIASNVAGASQIIHVGPGDTFLSVLPIHHSFECTCGFLLALYCGGSITYARSMKSADLIADIRETKVSLMVGVPLLYEKMQAGILRGIKKKGKTTEALFTGLYTVVKLGQKVGVNLSKAAFKSLREKGGLNSVRLFVSGGGPLDPAIADFFISLGINMIQGYGLTETSPVTHVTPPWKTRNTCVGLPIPGVECKLIDANELGVGEVCIKGPNVFAGYYQNEEATKKVMTEDGWFLTGDLGLIHSDGYLQIMGRCKNMLVTGGGKNIYPEEIEHHLNRSRFIAESLVLGITRQSGYGEEPAAMIYPDYEQIDLYFEELGKKPTNTDVHALIKQEVQAAQEDLADYKRIRHFRIVEEEFQKTSTKKIKRFLYKGEMLKLNGQSEQ